MGEHPTTVDVAHCVQEKAFLYILFYILCLLNQASMFLLLLILRVSDFGLKKFTISNTSFIHAVCNVSPFLPQREQ